MMRGKSVKASRVQPQSVAVIASAHDLARAKRLRRLPDLFELRLDAVEVAAAELEYAIARLRAPLIITARHPREGGLNDLSATRRRDLLLRFLPHAAFVDVELRSAKQLEDVLAAADERKVQRVISVHNLRRTPSVAELEKLTRAVEKSAPSVFKVATRTETPADLDRLVTFFERTKMRIPIAAMGIGALGRASRLQLAAGGSVLNYAHLGTSAAEGQLSLAELLRLTG
jgi:3-dehydroquinate dehydratase-1